MIISRTPLRISFVGGGTDLKAFYAQQPGMVVSAAINKYIYICIHRHFDGNSFLLKYSGVEEGSDVSKIKNNIIREAMKLTGVNGVEIVSMSDVPTTGIGLGSSSSFTVGLLNALYAYKGMAKSAEELAQDACKIEIDILGKPIGKQDQYIAAYGGLNKITFHPDDSVEIEKVKIPKNKLKELDANLMLFYTGKTRSADTILKEQKANTAQKMESLLKMRDFVDELKGYLNKGQLEKFGDFLNKNWVEKRKLANGITDETIDNYYKKAMNNGALGGKICGAGGGGFLLLYCPPEKQNDVRKSLADLEEMKFNFEPEGSKIIFNN